MSIRFCARPVVRPAWSGLGPVYEAKLLFEDVIDGPYRLALGPPDARFETGRFDKQRHRRDSD